MRTTAAALRQGRAAAPLLFLLISLLLEAPAAAAAAAAAAGGSSAASGGPHQNDVQEDDERPEFSVVVPAHEPLQEPWEQATEFGGVLKGEKVVRGCHMPEAKRHVEDGFLTEDDAALLLGMVERGMQGRDQSGGPTILDVNSGFCKDGLGLANIYQGEDRVTFTEQEYAVYRTMFERIRQRIMEVNGLDELYFTAPTFVARTIGSATWKPREPHDEYWHGHIDKENTFHYDYSGLVYLSTHGQDFEGGEFLFLDPDGYKAVLPRRGRFITFASGRENPHRFLKVTNGTRFAFSMWFTCDKSKQFATFLDGKAHQTVLSRTGKDEL